MKIRSLSLLVSLTITLCLSTGFAEDTVNLLENSTFELGTEPWEIHCSSGRAEVTNDGPDGQTALTFFMEEASKPRFSFWIDTDLAIAERFRVSFRARSDRGVVLLIAPQRASDDYGAVGNGSSVQLTPEWKEFSVVIQIREASTRGRLSFLPNDPVPPGRTEFTDFRLETIP